jgi:hypothetical protein
MSLFDEIFGGTGTYRMPRPEGPKDAETRKAEELHRYYTALISELLTMLVRAGVVTEVEAKSVVTRARKRAKL